MYDDYEEWVSKERQWERERWPLRYAARQAIKELERRREVVIARFLGAVFFFFSLATVLMVVFY